MLVDCTKALALTNLKIEPIYSELFLGWNSIFWLVEQRAGILRVEQRSCGITQH